MDKNKTEKLEKRWKKVQEHLKFTDEELAMYQFHPQNVKAMERAPLFATHRMAVEIIEAHNCAAGYEVGDKFVVDAEGCLIPEQCPSRLCVAAIFALKPLVDRMWQAYYDNSTEIFHDTVHCPDVGVRRGGAGAVTMRACIVPKDKVTQEGS